jgi:hypothetical protein
VGVSLTVSEEPQSHDEESHTFHLVTLSDILLDDRRNASKAVAFLKVSHSSLFF